MTYQALARKWRPRKFSEVVGQNHIVRTLTNAIEHERLHHAYLFTGTRGVGKTSIARILAKALNCSSRKSADPCGDCAICLDIDNGRFVDLIEVDAASRTKVEDTRDLLEKAQYAPAHGGFKIYLIDEVHMLSGHSFNALLKTLEEPPPHVKFLLATTDPQKIPVTVLSRCLQLNLKRLTAKQIGGQIESILEAEKIETESRAVEILARSADGSMRDGLSLLDQAIAHGAGRLAEQSVNDMLGFVAEEQVFRILQQLASGDAAALLETVNCLADITMDFSQILQQMLGQLHQLALMQAGAVGQDGSDANHQLSDLAKTISAADLQLYYQIGLLGQRDLELAPDSRSGFEMILLRMLEFKPAQNPPAAGNQGQKTVTSTDQLPTLKSDRQASDSDKASPAKKTDLVSDIDWQEFIRVTAINGMARELACNCVVESMDESKVNLSLDPDHKHLNNPLVVERLENAIQKFCKKSLKLNIGIGDKGMVTPAVRASAESNARQEAAESAIANDVNVKALEETFEAKVVPGSIEPQDTN